MAEDLAIGIDLGTTFSVVAVFKNGKVEIIHNDHGNRTTPSYVAFNDTERLIGDAAKKQAATNPVNTIFDAKRLIGRKFDDPTVQSDMELWPFAVVSSEGKPKIQITHKGVVESFFPEEISAMVLGKMKDIAESFLGRKVSKAVITVPAYFNDAQRQATKDAGAIAGLNVLRIINEPTAAAIAYGLEKKSSEKLNILVFDLGGGTFDVSIVSVDGHTFVVKATAGDTHLGGEDFDNRLLNRLVEEFKLENSQKNLTTNKKSLRRLRNACESAKINLSFSTKYTNIDIDCLFEGIDFSTKITRDDFEELNIDLFKRTMVVVEKAITDAKMTKESIHDIVLVGGSTRIPKIQKLLQDFFNGKELMKSINPDEAVAYGAAIQAAMLNGDISGEIKDLLFYDVTPLRLGVKRYGGIMDTIIPRNTTVPARVTKEYKTHDDNQIRMKIDVYEGERVMTNNNHLLGKFRLHGIPPAPGGEQGVEVTFDIDVNGILNVTALCKSTNKEEKMTITNDKNRLSQENIERMIERALKFRLEDQKQLETAEAKNSLTSYCNKVTAKVKDASLKGLISVFVENLVLDKSREQLQKLKCDNRVEKEEYERRLKELLSICEPILAIVEKLS